MPRTAKRTTNGPLTDHWRTHKGKTLKNKVMAGYIEEYDAYGRQINVLPKAAVIY